MADRAGDTTGFIKEPYFGNVRRMRILADLLALVAARLRRSEASSL